jgi:hypothetical protein
MLIQALDKLLTIILKLLNLEIIVIWFFNRMNIKLIFMKMWKKEGKRVKLNKYQSNPS